MQFGRFQKEKGPRLSHLPTLSPVVYRLAHSCRVTGKGCSGTQPPRKQFAAEQWQPFTSKPCINTAGLKAQGVNTPLEPKHFKTTSLPCSSLPFLLPDGPLFGGSSEQDLPAPSQQIRAPSSPTSPALQPPQGRAGSKLYCWF